MTSEFMGNVVKEAGRAMTLDTTNANLSKTGSKSAILYSKDLVIK